MPRVYIGRFPCKQPDRVTYSKNYGNAIVQEWVGPPDVMQGLAVQLRSIYETVEIDNGNLLTRVRGTTRAPQYGEAEAPVITFELQQSEQSVVLAQHPRYAHLSAAELALVRQAVDEHLNDSEFTAEWNAAVARTGSGVRALYKPDADTLLLRNRRGTENFRIYGWQFTRVSNVSLYYPTTIDLTNHGRLWTNEQINTHCGPLPNITLPVKAATQEQADANLAYRWFRSVSTVTLSNRGSFNLTEGWELALWDTDLYADAT